jgi:hypothetical protein
MDEREMIEHALSTPEGRLKLAAAMNPFTRKPNTLGEQLQDVRDSALYRPMFMRRYTVIDRIDKTDGQERNSEQGELGQPEA